MKIRASIALGSFRRPKALISRETSTGSIPITRSKPPKPLGYVGQHQATK
jgi:hypothetical protein